MDEVDYCYVPEGVSLPALISDTLVFEDEETQADDEDLEEQQVSSQLFQFNGVPTNEENNPLQLSDRTGTCKDDAPCQICEGDCDQGNISTVCICAPHLAFPTLYLIFIALFIVVGTNQSHLHRFKLCLQFGVLSATLEGSIQEGSGLRRAWSRRGRLLC